MLIDREVILKNPNIILKVKKRSKMIKIWSLGKCDEIQMG